MAIASWRRRKRGQKHLDQRLSALQDDLGRLQRDLKGLAAGGEKAASRVSDALDVTAQRALSAAERAAQQLESWADDSLEPVRDQVKTQPLTSVLISIGAGALVGLMLAGPRIGGRED